jgi:hypothetical protein
LFRRTLYLLFAISTIAYCDQQAPQGGGKATNTNTRWSEQGAQAFYDGTLQVNNAEILGKYLEMIAKSTVTVPAANHARIYLSTATQNICAIFSNNTTTCFGAAAITQITAGLGLSGGGITGNITVNLSTPIPGSYFGNFTISTITVTSSSTVTNETVKTQLTIPNGVAATDAAAFGQIHLFQIVRATSTTSSATTSNTFVNTHLSATITPSVTTHKILILASSQMGMASNNTNTCYITVANGSTNLASSNGLASLSNGQAVAIRSPTSLVWLDSPATTSAVTYNIQIRSDDGVHTCNYGDLADQSLVLMEVL